VSEHCASYLREEHVTGTIRVTGDPQFDVFAAVAPNRSSSAAADKQCLVTIHRAENVDYPSFLPAFISALVAAHELYGMQFTWPVHPRSRTQLSTDHFSAADLEAINLVEPMAYATTMARLASSMLCITDSGGLQKEAFWLRVPCVTMRPSTEWSETIALHANRLVPDPANLLPAIAKAFEDEPNVEWSNDPYGGTGSAERVAEAISQWVTSDE
jgi:UDP-GlcNAc3NAcA epimerase